MTFGECKSRVANAETRLNEDPCIIALNNTSDDDKRRNLLMARAGENFRRILLFRDEERSTQSLSGELSFVQRGVCSG